MSVLSILVLISITFAYNDSMSSDSSTMTSKGQITVPKRLRDAVGLKPGDVARFELLDDRTIAITRPRSVASVRRLVGAPSHAQPPTEKEQARLRARDLA